MLGYLSEQGLEQTKLQWSGRENQEILKDPEVSDEVKRKIRLIGEYKDFFYSYFGEERTSIYSKTTILSNKAVTYLLIASPKTKIEAKEFKFPFMGNFPYIGFFKKSSAEAFAGQLKREENLATYIRPVYAYSTLGYFEDRILSSFFEYNDIELAELIFHELFHTIFFIKDEVELNENLASLYGKELLKEYFKDRPELKKHFETQEKKNLLSQKVVELIGILQTEFTKLGGFITPEKADDLTHRFVSGVFIPGLKSYCMEIKLEDSECEIKDDWNQASFAAFLTYEEEQDFLHHLKSNRSLDLKQYLTWLRMEYKDYGKESKDLSFTDFLKTKVNHAPIAAD